MIKKHYVVGQFRTDISFPFIDEFHAEQEITVPAIFRYCYPLAEDERLAVATFEVAVLRKELNTYKVLDFHQMQNYMRWFNHDFARIWDMAAESKKLRYHNNALIYDHEMRARSSGTRPLDYDMPTRPGAGVGMFSQQQPNRDDAARKVNDWLEKRIKN